MGAKYTYYNADGTSEVSETEPREGIGKVWVRGEYHHPVYPSPTDMRIARGNKVWLIIDELDGRTIDDVVALYRPGMTRVDVQAAIEFYLRRKREIDAKLAEHRAVA